MSLFTNSANFLINESKTISAMEPMELFTCRSCLTLTSAAYPIFQASPALPTPITDMLAACAIEIDDFEPFPRTICIPCVEKLQQVNTFITKFKTNQEELCKKFNVEIIKIEQPPASASITITEEIADAEPVARAPHMETIASPTKIPTTTSITRISIPDTIPAFTVENPEAIVRTCPICPRYFRGTRPFRNHIIKHRKPIQCPQCDSAYATASAYLQHCASAPECYDSLRVILPPADAPQARLVEANASFACQFCDKSYQKFALLTRHLQALHEGPMTCDMCDLVCDSAAQYGEHYAQAHKFACPYCKRSFMRKQTVERHIRDVHGKQPDVVFACPFEGCEGAYDTQWKLRKHVNKLHTEEGTYVCTLCGAAFSSADNLSYHNKKHRGPRHLCIYCGKLFWQAIHLRYHSWRHTGVKPYNCDKCKRGFVSRKLFDGHRRRNECFEFVGEQVEVEMLDIKENAELYDESYMEQE